MAEYIERDFLLQWIDGIETENVRRSFNGLNPKGLNTDGMKHMVLKAPAADVVEVRHGYWISGLDTVCSVCKIDVDVYDVERFNYCPNCGAKMVKRRE